MNRIFKVAAACCAMVVLTGGCASIGRGPLVEAKVARTYGGGESSANQPVDDLLLAMDVAGPRREADEWWKAFGDERLNRLVAKVRMTNGDLASAALRIQRARASAERTGADLWPRVDGSVDASAGRALEADAVTSQSYRASLGVGWELDLWGKLRAQRDAAQWEANATQEDHDAVALSLVSETIGLYWTLAFLNQRLIAGEESLSRTERTLALVRVQFGAGAVSRVELSEAVQSTLSQRESQLELEQQRVEVRNALTLLLDGTPWPTDDEPQTIFAQVSPPVVSGLPAELLGRRPDLRAAELRLRKARAGIDIARTSYYPTLSLTGSAGTSSTALEDLLVNPVASLGAGIALPFLGWNEMKFEAETARIDYGIAVNDFRKALYTAFSEVDNALAQKAGFDEQVALAEESLAVAKTIERLYEARYRAGSVALRVWLEAQQVRRDAELSVAQLRLEQLTNDVTLVMALGGTGVGNG